MEIGTYGKSVAEEVRALLARRSIRRGWLAGQIGMSRHTLRSRLSGQSPFDVDEVAAIAVVLGVDSRDLMPTILDGAA